MWTDKNVKPINRTECKGCYALGKCDVPPYHRDYICPCLECIVKVMCSTSCENHSTYVWINIISKTKLLRD